MKGLELVKRVNEARVACAQVKEASGGLLSDDPCVLELEAAEYDLEAFDLKRRYSRRLGSLEVT